MLVVPAEMADQAVEVVNVELGAHQIAILV
jgi:hypothetical protein